MVGQVGADTGKVDANVDAQAREVVGRADPRTQQDGRAAIGPGREDDPIGMDRGAIHQPHAGRPAGLDDHARHHRIRANREVRQTDIGRQVGVEGRDPRAIPGAHGHRSGADGARGVVIGDRREADSGERLQGCGMDR